ncbi:hypothetical protein SERLA73DRAFT_190333 [Serpula lacrymans var. lacrymans S7.3]|uniref:DUF3752 domain-containing protein n=2 Tax=Serpula lacrymans var. lacrymans TaxID=341189 RepID=F8QFH5_SERL3|nr:uncharacterized protein SERLADRAFT_479362 [Serpula lacrymans var. lacrymans S7.9]EGN92959.1 hypothetical protein SERLA73DRAFT_190333 [Serpula lacrymans var. lacrymans S7.3]EGO19674.1 hypothetical protein SERLADRAFT_479362 [Serpula lacrymans var. lacrymans S7.9]
MASIGPQIPVHLLNKASSSSSHSSGSDAEEIGPAIPKSLDTSLNNDGDGSFSIGKEVADGDKGREQVSDEDEDDYMPALPPDLLASRTAEPSSSTATSKRTVGPSLPPSHPSYSIHRSHEQSYTQDSDSDSDIGPRPLPSTYGSGHSSVGDGVREFIEREERRRKLVEEAKLPKKLERDEWMLVPPTKGDLLGSLDPTKLKARQFSRSTAPSRNVDSSLWTETPAERQQRLADEVSGKKRRAVNADPDEDDFDDKRGGQGKEERKRERERKKRREEDIRRGVDEHTRKTRGPSLIDQHATLSSQPAASSKDEPSSIWDHTRDMSLSGRLMDDSARDKYVRDARTLGDRFGTGRTGGFL